VLIASNGFGCTCRGSGGRFPRESAQIQFQTADAVFEGLPERFDLRWSILDASERDAIPATRAVMAEKGLTAGEWPHLLITFRVLRTYKGNLGSTVSIVTGLVTQDCTGARFYPGFEYLLYARKSQSGELSMGLCSPYGWTRSTEVEGELRYLRHQPPVPSDLQRVRDWTAEGRRLYEASTGKICGSISGAGPGAGTVSFLPSIGYSPFIPPTAEVMPDGSFCSDWLGPGKYYLHYTEVSGTQVTSAVFYPGVTGRAQAATVEVVAGETRSGIKFNPPRQEPHSVRGLISTNDKAGLGDGDAVIQLVRSDGAPQQAWHAQWIDFKGMFPLPKVKYFRFENVLPGQYVAYVSVPQQGWLTKVVHVEVKTGDKFIVLELDHRM